MRSTCQDRHSMQTTDNFEQRKEACTSITGNFTGSRSLQPIPQVHNLPIIPERDCHARRSHAFSRARRKGRNRMAPRFRLLTRLPDSPHRRPHRRLRSDSAQTIPDGAPPFRTRSLRPRARLARSGAHVSGVWSPLRARAVPTRFSTTERTRPPCPRAVRREEKKKQELTRGPGQETSGPTCHWRRTGKGGRDDDEARFFSCPLFFSRSSAIRAAVDQKQIRKINKQPAYPLRGAHHISCLFHLAVRCTTAHGGPRPRARHHAG